MRIINLDYKTADKVMCLKIDENVTRLDIKT